MEIEATLVVYVKDVLTRWNGVGFQTENELEVLCKHRTKRGCYQRFTLPVTIGLSS